MLLIPDNRPPRPRRGVEVYLNSFFHLGTRWRWLVNATPRALYPRETICTHSTGDWVGPRAGLDVCGKSRPIRIRSPDRPSRSQSLYRLSYPGQRKKYGTVFNHKLFSITECSRTSLHSKILFSVYFYYPINGTI
jgi:hypothetical protein